MGQTTVHKHIAGHVYEMFTYLYGVTEPLSATHSDPFSDPIIDPLHRHTHGKLYNNRNK